MAYGLRIIGEHGYTQIDEHYRNLFLINKTTASIYKAALYRPPGNNSGTLQRITDLYRYNKIQKNSIVAFRNLTQGFNEPQLIHMSNYESFTDIMNLSHTHDQEVEIFEFGVVNSVSSSGFGLVVKSPNNDVVFDSNHKPMRVIGTFGTAIPGAGGSSVFNNVGKLAIASNISYSEPINHIVWSVRPTVVYHYTSKVAGYSVWRYSDGKENFIYEVDNARYYHAAGTGNSQINYNLRDFTLFIDVTGY